MTEVTAARVLMPAVRQFLGILASDVKCRQHLVISDAVIIIFLFLLFLFPRRFRFRFARFPCDLFAAKGSFESQPATCSHLYLLLLIGPNNTIITQGTALTWTSRQI